MGTQGATLEAVNELISLIQHQTIYCVIDGDAFKAIKDRNEPLGPNFILTPHNHEFRLLTGKDAPIHSEVLGRGEAVLNTADKFQCTIVLKGPTDYVSDGRRLKLNRTGNSGMTVGGTGDILAGVIGGFAAQGASLFYSAVAGAFITGTAGDRASSTFGNGLIASDLLSVIPQILKESSTNG